MRLRQLVRSFPQSEHAIFELFKPSVLRLLFFHLPPPLLPPSLLITMTSPTDILPLVLLRVNEDSSPIAQLITATSLAASPLSCSHLFHLRHLLRYLHLSFPLSMPVFFSSFLLSRHLHLSFGLFHFFISFLCSSHNSLPVAFRMIMPTAFVCLRPRFQQ